LGAGASLSAVGVVSSANADTGLITIINKYAMRIMTVIIRFVRFDLVRDFIWRYPFSCKITSILKYQRLLLPAAVSLPKNQLFTV
jgi:hypothetical protein